MNVKLILEALANALRRLKEIEGRQEVIERNLQEVVDFIREIKEGEEE